MAKELIAFLNFEFEQKQVFIKSVSGETLTEVPRFVINWHDYQDVLASLGLKYTADERPLFQRYTSHKSNEDFFNDLISFQGELQSILSQLIERRRIKPEVWKRIFKDTNELPVNISLDGDDDITPENIASLNFHYDFTADTYRLCILAMLRSLIMNGQIFNLSINEAGHFYYLEKQQANEHDAIYNGHVNNLSGEAILADADNAEDEIILLEHTLNDDNIDDCAESIITQSPAADEEYRADEVERTYPQAENHPTAACEAAVANSALSSTAASDEKASLEPLQTTGAPTTDATTEEVNSVEPPSALTAANLEVELEEASTHYNIVNDCSSESVTNFVNGLIDHETFCNKESSFFFRTVLEEEADRQEPDAPAEDTLLLTNLIIVDDDEQVSQINSYDKPAHSTSTTSASHEDLTASVALSTENAEASDETQAQSISSMHNDTAGYTAGQQQQAPEVDNREQITALKPVEEDFLFEIPGIKNHPKRRSLFLEQRVATLEQRKRRQKKEKNIDDKQASFNF